MAYVVRPMRLEDIDQVVQVERQCFTTPWPAQAYRREIRDNRLGRYTVLAWEDDEEKTGAEDQRDHREPSSDDRLVGMRRAVSQLLRPFNRVAPAVAERRGTIVGFAGMWLMLDEAHITTICVSPQVRGRNLGELLFVHIIEMARMIEARRVTLEVRISNDVAQSLYRKYGFTTEGVRRRYYSDNNEDALIMWSEPLDGPSFRTRYESLKSVLHERLAQNPPPAPPD